MHAWELYIHVASNTCIDKLILTYLICMSKVEGIDLCREPLKFWYSWPHCFIKAVCEVET